MLMNQDASRGQQVLEVNARVEDARSKAQMPHLKGAAYSAPALALGWGRLRPLFLNLTIKGKLKIYFLLNKPIFQWEISPVFECWQLTLRQTYHICRLVVLPTRFYCSK